MSDVFGTPRVIRLVDRTLSPSCGDSVKETAQRKKKTKVVRGENDFKFLTVRQRV